MMLFLETLSLWMELFAFYVGEHNYQTYTQNVVHKITMMIIFIPLGWYRSGNPIVSLLFAHSVLLDSATTRMLLISVKIENMAW